MRVHLQRGDMTQNPRTKWPESACFVGRLSEPKAASSRVERLRLLPESSHLRPGQPFSKPNECRCRHPELKPQ